MIFYTDGVATADQLRSMSVVARWYPHKLWQFGWRRFTISVTWRKR